MEQCIALDRLKAASRAVRAFSLKADFPDVEAMYRQRTLARLVQKRLWSVAATFVGSDPALRVSHYRFCWQCCSGCSRLLRLQLLP